MLRRTLLSLIPATMLLTLGVKPLQASTKPKYPDYKDHDAVLAYIREKVNADWAKAVTYPHEAAIVYEQWANAVDVDIKHLEEGRWNIIDRMIDVFTAGFLYKLEKEGLDNGKALSEPIQIYLDHSMEKVGKFAFYGYVNLKKGV